MMPQKPITKWLQRVDIFISSPNDVEQEREAIIRVIEKLNRLSYIRSRYVLNPLLYEREVPPEAGEHAQLIVDRYMAAEDSYLLICLMWNRIGTSFIHPYTGESFQSGTEYEFTAAYRANQINGTPILLLYRKTATDPYVDNFQKEKVDHFFKKFDGGKATFKGLYKSFVLLSEFENMLFEHIERILHGNPPNTDRIETKIDANTRPELLEEARRLDIAMPRECQLGQSTEVRVMICLPNSGGLKTLLPDYAAEDDLIDKRDVQESNLAVAFPVEKMTGKIKPTMVEIELKSEDFQINDAIQQIQLFAGHDSGLIVFNARATKLTRRGRIYVIVKSTTLDGYTVTLGSGSTSTIINSKFSQVARQIVWSILSIPFAAMSGDLSSLKARPPRGSVGPGINFMLKVESLDTTSGLFRTALFSHYSETNKNVQGRQLKNKDELYYALRLYQKRGDQLGQANTLQTLGDIDMQTSNLDVVLIFYDRLPPVYDELDDQVSQVTTLNKLGGTVVRGERLDAARVLYEQALLLYEQIGEHMGEANILRKLGDLNVRLNQLDTARDFYTRALPLYEQTGSRLGRANTLRGLGTHSMRIDQLDAARILYEQALPLYEQIGDRQDQANMLEALGDISMRVGQLDAARAFYDRALPLYKIIYDTVGHLNVLINYARLAWQAGNTSKAKQIYKELFSIIDGSSTFHGYPIIQDWRREYTQFETLGTLSRRSTLSREMIQQLAQNTYGVMTGVTDKRDEWRHALQVLRNTWAGRSEDYLVEVAFAEALLAVLDNLRTTLPEDNPYADTIRQVVAAIQEWQTEQAD